MTATLEISMYPLREDYETQVLAFLELLHRESALEIRVNAMSTQVKGDLDLVFDTLRNSIKEVYQNGVKASFVIKTLEGDLDLGYRYDG
ncbi:MAG TPA: YkoF family thiamine/hydroxymethylpyrimidine-binding protein [Cryomorphaceae bacterium]|nr:YkoF family thiamine/hydroxymethylpyrimidine-binding protein [Cryomorphaceae bacterium]HKL40209.1 YkoF family thiamine/hydroxymethylpyrimidine-binding protein [Cryomorphaceae bacterium]